MYQFYLYMLGKSRHFSILFNAKISRWSAVAGLVFSPILFFTGINIENYHGLVGYAIVFYGAALILFIPFAIELYLTSKNEE